MIMVMLGDFYWVYINKHLISPDRALMVDTRDNSIKTLFIDGASLLGPLTKVQNRKILLGVTRVHKGNCFTKHSPQHG